MTCIHIYFCRICMEKQRKQKQKKKNSPLCRVFKPKHSAKELAQVSSAVTLPSAKVLALGKDLNVCRVPLPWHSANQTRGGTLARGLCRVSAVRHSANRGTRVAPRGFFAEYQGTRQNLCRVPVFRHSAKSTLPWEPLPSVVCRVLHSAKTLPSGTCPLPSVTDTRQSLEVR